jgi:glycosyltransferase involved in cell wall biosynthesis
MQPPKVCVVIPAYNEGKAIGRVLTKAVSAGLDIIVIDDGSSDDTAAVARQFDVHLIVHETNQGKGVAIRTSIAWALEENYDAALFMDADGQHDPKEIPRFSECYAATRADLVLGSRMHSNEKMPLVRKLSNQFSSLLVSSLAGTRVTDSQSGFRLLSAKLLTQLQTTGGSGFDFETEMIIDAVWQGLRFCEVPISCIYADETSHYHPLKDSLQFFTLVARKGLEKLRRRPGAGS